MTLLLPPEIPYTVNPAAPERPAIRAWSEDRPGRRWESQECRLGWWILLLLLLLFLLARRRRHSS